MRARHVERLDAAGGAEEVLRDPGIEGVAGERIIPREQAEARPRHDQVEEAELAAHRAVALGGLDVGGRVDLEADAAAVAAALVADERHGRVETSRSP
jgi:hypothetical protein